MAVAASLTPNQLARLGSYRQSATAALKAATRRPSTTRPTDPVARIASGASRIFGAPSSSPSFPIISPSFPPHRPQFPTDCLRAWIAPSQRRAASASASPIDASTEKEASAPGESETDTWQVKLLYDGDCPICMKEVAFLRARNQSYGTLKFVDIAAEGYDEQDNAGVTFKQAMDQIHGIKRDGTIITGIEAFRTFYEVIGLGWVYAVTKFAPVGAAADALYEVWAKYRLPLSGRPSLQAVIEERRRAKFGVQGCKEDEECEVKF